jgi:hypothetical protein
MSFRDSPEFSMASVASIGNLVLSARLPGTWRLHSRIDVDGTGKEVPDPALDSAPVALLFYDRTGNFAAQFMNPNRNQIFAEGPAIAKNNTQAVGGYDAYFGKYAVDDATGVVTQTLLGSLSKENVGAIISRTMTVTGDSLVIKLETAAWNGTPVIRKLTWERIG